MYILENPYRLKGGFGEKSEALLPSINAITPQMLLNKCPSAGITPMKKIKNFRGIGQIFVKDERSRMGLGSFKALGAAYVVAREAQLQDQKNKIYVTASAGNHGISVAAGARVFGAQAVVVLSKQVPMEFAKRLKNLEANVIWAGDDYAESLVAAHKAAELNDWFLLSDTSWAGYTKIPRRVMEGYIVAAAEAVTQIPVVPSHILLQAGVGGFAAAAAAYFRHVWGNSPKIFVIEPDAAPALFQSIDQGRLATCTGPDSIMGRLDCKTPSLIALNGLARDADEFHLISDNAVASALPELKKYGLETSPSGGVSLAALHYGIPGINNNSRVLCFVTEQKIE